MSVWGGIFRDLNVLSIRMHRSITEQSTAELVPGWHLEIEVPFVTFTVDNLGWDTSMVSRVKDLVTGKRKVYLTGQNIVALGFAVDWLRNTNNGRMYVEGDASESLLDRFKYTEKDGE